MRSFLSLAMCGVLVGSFALAGCGDDDGGTGGSGGAGGEGGSSTTTTGVGGEGGEGEGGAGEGGAGEGGAGEGGAGEGGAGEGGAGEGGADTGIGPDESCSGCARLSVPLTESGQATQFLVTFDEPMDLTGATITYRVKTYAGTNGGVQPYVQNGDELEWATAGWGWNPVSELKEWTDITIDVDAAVVPEGSAPFDKSQVLMFGLQITAGDEGPWTSPTVVYVDSITVTRPASAGGEGAGGAGDGGAGGAGDGGAGGAGGAGDGGAGGAGDGGAGGAGDGGAGGAGDGGAGGAGDGGAGGAGDGGAGGAGDGGAGGAGDGGAGGAGDGGAGGGEPSVEVIHVVGPFEFAADAEPLEIGSYMPVSGSTLLHLAE
ncbi:hypothetical protein SOCEGT47_012860 [Sorangium cellulosum]|uniref:PE-PGRS family protein n=1 Tax=Sorangium cellulosum TaxID=56 RepID=A0A4V0NCY7_SORCE|nr:hypothetical protein [Sorangium cellulosum]AUX20812.1 hypothetical protein SOCEGT47_012860 [Sorangium cellulosum]